MTIRSDTFFLCVFGNLFQTSLISVHSDFLKWQHFLGNALFAFSGIPKTDNGFHLHVFRDIEEFLNIFFRSYAFGMHPVSYLNPATPQTNCLRGHLRQDGCNRTVLNPHVRTPFITADDDPQCRVFQELRAVFLRL